MDTKPLTKLLPHEITAKKSLKPVKTTVRFKKADVRQCRLCLRVLPRGDVRLTVENDAYDFRRKIIDAVGVTIVDGDKVQGVCANCLLLVDIIGNFRESCRKADIIHGKRLLMMHPGSWSGESSKKVFEDCHNLVKRNRSEMDALYQCFERREEEEAVKERMKPEPGTDQDMEVQSESKRGYSALESPEPQINSVPSSHRKNVMCDICGEFKESSQMEGHRNRHLDTRPYACANDGCDKRFFCGKSLSNHVATMHTGTTRLWECEICQRKIKGKSHLKLHMAIHEAEGSNPRKTSCHICGKMFYKCYLKDHMAVHTGEMAYNCALCDRSFAAMNNWISHCKKTHPDVECNPRNVSRRVVEGVKV
ncbi:transcription factor Ouib [Aedes aegypti]|uniref:C2H2-type domain-containing protein n=1 Tax=Aedes aegypti TaxID=7159 RepID=A0A6I8TEA7_AEDAE|nr:transcription factor Ouib [Aedes aegypti]